MSANMKLKSGNLFFTRPKAVTVGVCLAFAIAASGLFIGIAMTFGIGSVYVSPGISYIIGDGASPKQGYFVIIESLVFMISALRAWQPAQIARLITVGMSSLTSVLVAIIKLSGGFTFGSLPGLISQVILLALPAVLLMSKSASEYYGEW